VLSQVGLAIQNGGLSPGFFPRMRSYSPAVESPPSQPISDSGEDLDPTRSHRLNSPLRLGVVSKKHHSGLLVVDGSLSGQSDLESLEVEGQEHELPAAMSISASEDLAFDTPSSSDDQSHDQLATANNRSQYQANDLDREVTPTEFKSTLAKTGPAKTIEIHRASPTSPAYRNRDPLSPVREDQLPSPFSASTPDTAGIAKPAVLSPNLKRMVIPDIPSFDSLRKKNIAPQALSSRTNGLPAALASNSQARIPPAAVPAALQSAWLTQGKKKKSKKVTEAGSRSPAVNGHPGEDLPQKAAERKGG